MLVLKCSVQTEHVSQPCEDDHEVQYLVTVPTDIEPFGVMFLWYLYDHY